MQLRNEIEPQWDIAEKCSKINILQAIINF
jgi:hypothetical protein